MIKNDGYRENCPPANHPHIHLIQQKFHHIGQFPALQNRDRSYRLVIQFFLQSNHEYCLLTTISIHHPVNLMNTSSCYLRISKLTLVPTVTPQTRGNICGSIRILHLRRSAHSTVTPTTLMLLWQPELALSKSSPIVMPLWTAGFFMFLMPQELSCLPTISCKTRMPINSFTKGPAPDRVSSVGSIRTIFQPRKSQLFDEKVYGL